MKKRICFVVSRLMHLGPIIVLEDIVRGMNQADWEVWIVSLRPEDKHWTIRDRFVTMGCRCVSLGFSMWDLELRTATVARQLDQLIKREEIEIIHSHGYHPDLVSALLPSHIYKVNTLHNICGDDYVYSKGRLLGSYMVRRHMRVLLRLDCLVAISKHVEQYYRDRLRKDNKLTCIYNGIDTDRFYLRAPSEKIRQRVQLGIAEDATVFVYSGVLNEVKDPLLLADSFVRLLETKQLPSSAYLLLLGSGDLEERCRRRIPEGMSEHIRLMGFCPDVVPYLTAADIALTASRSEGFGLSVVEAVAMGLPIVASNIPPHREILGKYPMLESLLFDVGNSAALMDSMLRVYKHLTDWPADAVSIDVRARFSARTMSLNYQALYPRSSDK